MEWAVRTGAVNKNYIGPWVERRGGAEGAREYEK